MKIQFKAVIISFFLIVIFSNNLFAVTKPKVLVLHSYHPAYKWTHDVNNGINSVFTDVTKVDLFVEYMDTKKYYQPEYIETLTSIYKQKYKDIKFDVIISSDDNAFNFLKNHTRELFQNTPVVFCGTNNIKKDAIKGFDNFTGVNEGVDLQKNYDLIFKLHPDVKNIYTITDTTTTGKLVKKESLHRINKYKDTNVNFHILDNMTLDELVEKISKLPNNSVILFTLYFKTKDEKFLSYHKAIDKIEENSNTPIYGLWDFTLNHGIIGGFLTSGYFQGQKAASMAQDILKGVPVKDIPIIFKSPNKYMFDYKQVKKYNINENQIPYDTVFINKKDSLFEVYYKEIVGIIILFVIMIIFIVILLINIKKRQIAEEEVKSLNYELNRLLSTFDTNVIASKTNIDGNLVYVSEAFLKKSGYKESELIGQTHNILKSGLNDDLLYKELWDTISSKKIWQGEIVNKNKEGILYTLYTIITPEYDKDGNFLNYTSISQDISARKLVEKANKEIELLNEDIVATQKEIIYRLGGLAESRSKETGLHVKRVAKYSELLALYSGLSEKEADIVKTASPMHDIGKIAIPDAILNKPARYTESEFEIMKNHAKIGYDMLKGSNKEILKAASIIAYEHQEKYDGSGYPQGLKGEDIHIYGRITAIADVFDALGSERVYKKAWNDEEIFKLFREESGKHFDPKLIELFFKHLDEFLKIRDEMKDII